MTRRSTAWVSSVLSCAAASAVYGAPYASGITETGGNVTFRLNENADSVSVIRDGVSSALTGPFNRGSISFARSGATNYSVVVTKNAGPGYTTFSSPGFANLQQISPEPTGPSDWILNFEQSQGIVVNKNPANGALFGRIYVANTRSNPTALGRLVTDGVYVINPDLTDAVGQGDTARDAGLIANFIVGGGSSPFRLQLDDSGLLYISDWSDAAGTIYRTDADVNTGSNILAGQGSTSPTGDPTSSLNHGSVGGFVVTGSSAGGNLVIHEVDEDLTAPGTLNSLWRFNINGATLPYTGIPEMRLNGVLLSGAEVSGGIITDVSRRHDGKLYVSQNRADGNEVGLVVTANDGTTVLFHSLQETTDLGLDGDPTLDGTQDVLRRILSTDVSPDGRFLAVKHGAVTGDTLIVPLLAGIPDLRNIMTLSSFAASTTRGEVAFDAAGNLYDFNAGEEVLRIFAPGGLSVTRTNSNGTFSSLPEYTGGSGNINDASKWLAGAVPNGADHGALFGSTTAGPITVTVNTPTTYSNMLFNNAGGYTLSGTSTITLSGGSPEIRSIAGNHTISAPVSLNQSTGIVVEAGTTTISNLNYAASPVNPISIFKGGAGTAAVNKINVETLRVLEGTMKIVPNGTAAGTGNAKRLLVSSGPSSM